MENASIWKCDKWRTHKTKSPEKMIAFFSLDLKATKNWADNDRDFFLSRFNHNDVEFANVAIEGSKFFCLWRVIILDLNHKFKMRGISFRICFESNLNDEVSGRRKCVFTWKKKYQNMQWNVYLSRLMSSIINSARLDHSHYDYKCVWKFARKENPFVFFHMPRKQGFWWIFFW